uniref:Uncharacterized protein n=1 Tax=Anguilla anguilla TaxID=7936 RepID=A0A0E9TXP2_ANGAN
MYVSLVSSNMCALQSHSIKRIRSSQVIYFKTTTSSSKFHYK